MKNERKDNAVVEQKAKKVAATLEALLTATFGGKSAGRFSIRRKDVRELFETTVLTDSMIEHLTQVLADEHKLAFVDTGDNFSILELAQMARYRMVSKNALEAATQAVFDASFVAQGNKHG